MDNQQLISRSATWAVNHPDPSERRRLMDGHRMRRQDREHGGLVVTDHSAADAWLMGEYNADA